MDRDNFYIFTLTVIITLYLQNNPTAAVGDNCTDTGGCDDGEECRNDTCICKDQHYEITSGNCSSIDELKPGLNSPSSTFNSVYLNWTSPPADKYSNSYVIQYGVQGQTNQIHHVNGDVTSTTVEGLNPGSTYSFTVVRTIEREGRPQPVPPSDVINVTTSGNFGDDCGNDDECRDNFTCFNKCLCPDKNYYSEGLCTTTDVLKPIDLTTTSTLNSVSLSWTSPPASGYTDSYMVKYKIQGQTQQEHNVSGDGTSTAVQGLTSGTTYTFIVVRYISREGRTQSVQESDEKNVKTKSSHGQPCSDSTNCGAGLVCFPSIPVCLCPDDQYYNGKLPCSSINELTPGFTIVGSDLSTITVNLTEKPPAINYTSTYHAIVNPGYINKTLNDDSITEIGSLTSGTVYNITVTRTIMFAGKSKTTNATDIQTYSTKPAAISRLNEAKSNFTGPNITVAFKKAAGGYSSYSVRLTGEGNDDYNQTLTATKQTDGNFSVVFHNVTSGNYYSVTVVTVVTYGDKTSMSDPFTRRLRVVAAQASEVLEFTQGSVTSRSVEVSWKKPEYPNGKLYEYSLEIYQHGACTWRIVFNCTECARNSSQFDDMTPKCPINETFQISHSNISDKNYTIEYNITVLQPDSQYEILAVAYNEEGRGKVPSESVKINTTSEAARAPRSLTKTAVTAHTVSLTWVPETPRPGKTSYIVVVYERNENDQNFAWIKNETVLGYDNNSLVVTNLSSYWDYKFSVQSLTNIPPPSEFTKLGSVVTTEESGQGHWIVNQPFLANGRAIPSC